MFLNVLKDYFLTPVILKFMIAAFACYCFDFASGFSTAWENHNIQSTKLRGGVDKFVKYTIYLFIGCIADLMFNTKVATPIFCSRIILIELKSLDENFKKIGLDIPQWIYNLFTKKEDGYIEVVKKKKTAAELVKYVKHYMGHPYWYGCFGQISSFSLYTNKKRQYPTQYQWNCPESQLNKRVFDCVGLIKAYLWSDKINSNPKYNASQDVSANGMRDKCKTGGSISTLPELPGALVFSPGHVGVYIGGGYVVEARGHKYGVVKTKLKERGFTSWGLCPWIEYPEYKPSKKENKKGCYPIYKGDSKSIVDALKSLKIDSTKAHRQEIALANGFKSYSGTPKQNEKLLALLKAGKLIKP